MTRRTSIIALAACLAVGGCAADVDSSDPAPRGLARDNQGSLAAPDQRSPASAETRVEGWTAETRLEDFLASSAGRKIVDSVSVLNRVTVEGEVSPASLMGATKRAGSVALEPQVHEVKPTVKQRITHMCAGDGDFWVCCNSLACTVWVQGHIEQIR
jgi:hypothetical protein